MTFGLGLPEFLVARWTPVLAGSRRIASLDRSSSNGQPYLREKQSDERNALQYCDRPFLKNRKRGREPLVHRL